MDAQTFTFSGCKNYINFITQSRKTESVNLQNSERYKQGGMRYLDSARHFQFENPSRSQKVCNRVDYRYTSSDCISIVYESQSRRHFGRLLRIHELIIEKWRSKDGNVLQDEGNRITDHTQDGI